MDKYTLKTKPQKHTIIHNKGQLTSKSEATPSLQCYIPTEKQLKFVLKVNILFKGMMKTAVNKLFNAS